MALWQFDCYIIPRENCVAENNSSDEDILSWKKRKISSVKINFLEKQASWIDDIVQYGKENETCIQFLYEDELLEEINCRFDLRSLTKKMLEKILDYVQKIKGMIFYEGKTYYPDMDEIVELMKKSNANKFCQNPKNYFEEFSDNELV
ncbi:MAG: hypothetical protein NC412_10825 [Roseburia sp.]|nr:hypothetical protein [Roseburia sp.]MCM1279109.1 hypothetical protein [Robinsoniella sp.]